ncbi:unnamed protein product [Acanthosepion pharaonis]|uniref:Uncharacterized protein n=1 Tax=Acanthosepion pharaonis TaxID=158019 RepID=A0A812CVF4_ACAPH|nr:unnamed protein product [Sepia pharaonis]
MKTVNLKSCFFALITYFLVATIYCGTAQNALCNSDLIKEQKNFIRVIKRQQLSENESLPIIKTWTRKAKCEKRLTERSLCPWDCYENYNATRYPQIIKEKICKKRLNRGRPNSCRVVDSDEMHCANVTTSIQVLEFVHHCNHFDIYRNQTIQVHTGCSCINSG